jgi:non-ribosomal peptide synthetase component F
METAPPVLIVRPFMNQPITKTEAKIMAANFAAQQTAAKRFSNVLRKYEFEGGNPQELAESVGQELRDLRRWADGTSMPAHVILQLLAALPRHLADELIKPTGLRLVARDTTDSANALLAASRCSALSSDITQRHADGVFCHQDKAAVQAEAKRLIADLEGLAAGYE